MEKKLQLNEKLEKSWLIQRLHPPTGGFKIGGVELVDNPFSFGGGLRNGGLGKKAMELLRPIFEFDYMGSSEFEWGAVPNALEFMSKTPLVTGAVNLDPDKVDEVVYYVCPIPYEEGVQVRITELYKATVRLKARCDLNEYFDKTSKYPTRTRGWLELDNGFAFFVDKTMYEKFCKILELTPKYCDSVLA
jgi:hypothetical protein